MCWNPNYIIRKLLQFRIISNSKNKTIKKEEKNRKLLLYYYVLWYSFTDKSSPVKKYIPFLKVMNEKVSFSLDSADDFDIVTLRVDSGLFHCVTVQDCGYADC